MNHRNAARMDRRQFLKHSAAVTLAASALGRATASDAKVTPIGIQSYTVQGDLIRDFEGTLATLRRIGYREMELLGLLGFDARTYRKALDRVGLSAPSAHIQSKVAQSRLMDMATGKLTSDEAWPKVDAAMDLNAIGSILDEMFEQAEVLGHKYLVLATVGDYAKLYQTKSGIDQVITACIKAGDLCHQRGLRFAIHPHLAEYSQIDGIYGIDRILAASDPHKVFIEMDFFWATMAAVDVPAFLERHSGRVHLGHIKDVRKGIVVDRAGYQDYAKLPPSPFEDVGSGQLDYRKLLPLARKAGMRHFFVERDNAPDPLKNAANSYAALRPLLT